MKKICCISTISGTLEDFVIPAMDEFIALGYEVTLISSMTDSFLTKYSHKYKCVHWGMSRGVSLYDIIVMPWKFRKIFKEEQFDLVQYCTPNASFYASIGAKLAGVSKRLYCQWGIRYVGANGIMRSLLKTIEKITCRLSTHIRCASKKNMDFALKEGLFLEGKASIIGEGGTVGVDLMKFSPQNEKCKQSVLEELPLLKNKIVYAYVGRIQKDKGVEELLRAFIQLNNNYNDVALLLLGRNDGVIDQSLLDKVQAYNVIFYGYTNNVAKYLNAADVLVHPSYREGFSMVIQQAMAMKLPVITTNIPGPSEVIVENVTGRLVPPYDYKALFEMMKWMLENPDTRKKMGEAGYERCCKLFTRKRMVNLTIEDRINIINS